LYPSSQSSGDDIAPWLGFVLVCHMIADVMELVYYWVKPMLAIIGVDNSSRVKGYTVK